MERWHYCLLIAFTVVLLNVFMFICYTSGSDGEVDTVKRIGLEESCSIVSLFLLFCAFFYVVLLIIYT